MLGGRAPVPELLEHPGPRRVQAQGHLLVEREHPVVEHRDVGGGCGVNPGDLEDGERSTSPGPSLVVRDQILADRPGAVGGPDDPIGERAAADIQRLEHVGVGHGHPILGCAGIFLNFGFSYSNPVAGR